jgi:hypothetical protein
MFNEIWPVLVPAIVGSIVFIFGLFIAIAERRSRKTKELLDLQREVAASELARDRELRVRSGGWEMM